MTLTNTDTRHNHSTYLRKTGVQIANHTQRPGVRTARIEQVSKPARAVPLGELTPRVTAASPYLTAAASSGASARQFERTRIEAASDSGMFKVPLITPNTSLPTGTE